MSRRERERRHRRRVAHQKTSRALLRDERAQAAEDAAEGRSRPVAVVPPEPPSKVRRSWLRRRRRPKTRAGRRDVRERLASKPRSIHDLAHLAMSGRGMVEASWRRTFRGIHTLGRPGSRGGLQPFAATRPSEGPRAGKRRTRNRARARMGPHVCPACGAGLVGRRGELRCPRHGGAWWTFEPLYEGR